MTDQYGYVNPLNVAEIAIEDLDGVVLDLFGRASISVRLPIEGSATESRSFQLGEEAVPEWDVYVRTLDEAPLPGPRSYYTPVDVLSFRNAADDGPGVVKDPTSQVVLTRTWAEIPIADLYQIKENDIFAYDQVVRYNAVDTSINPNWWIIVTRDARFELNGIQGNWLQRQIDGDGWPGGINRPWVGIYNANTEVSRRSQVDTDVQWNTLYLEITQHDQATGNATDASGTALDAAYGDESQANFAAVAAHDPEDPTWGYPPTVTL